MTLGKCKAVLEGHGEYVLTVAWSPNGQRLASGSIEKTIRIWDVARGECLAKLEAHKGYVYSVAWSPDGHRLATASADAIIRIWDAETWEILSILKGAYFTSLVWSKDGLKLASTSISTDPTVTVWDLETEAAAFKLEGHSDNVYNVAWTPELQRLASGGDDKTIRIWDEKSGKETQILERHTGWVIFVDFSCYDISGGYVRTSAKEDIGLDELKEAMRLRNW